MLVLLKVDNVTKRFGQLMAVEKLSFSVNRGEVLGIVGQNGAGKSTTFKMILNFLVPDQGRITIDNRELDEKILNKIGFLPEERGLYFNMSIKEQILYFARLHAYNGKQAERELPFWMNALAVKGNEETLIKDLSKGNQQKVQLITALIHHPQLVILDEPFSGLDPVNIGLLIEIVKKLRQEGAAVIFSSHNMKNVSEVSDKILMLVDGKQRLYGPINEIRAAFGRNKVYLEGVFNDIAIERITGVEKIVDDYPGKIITFDSERHARDVVDLAKQCDSLQGYRLLPPTLDDIFCMITESEVARHG
ncbi:ATP-binding cassette domain-containing protein [Limosilactobacillus sp. WILCCON 0050]